MCRFSFLTTFVFISLFIGLEAVKPKIDLKQLPTRDKLDKDLLAPFVGEYFYTEELKTHLQNGDLIFNVSKECVFDILKLMWDMFKDKPEEYAQRGKYIIL